MQIQMTSLKNEVLETFKTQDFNNDNNLKNFEEWNIQTNFVLEENKNEEVEIPISLPNYKA